MKVGDFGEEFLCCAVCGDTRLTAPSLHDGHGGLRVPVALQERVAAHWPTALSLLDAEARIVEKEARIAETVGRAWPILEAAGLVDEVEDEAA